jgi:aminoglycoside phosphotransferase (APT) family kinase protein
MGEPQTPPDASHRPILDYLKGEGLVRKDAAPAFSLLSGGNSHITWRVSLDPVDLVVKVAQPDGPLAPYDITHEAKMMRIAAELGAAVPEVVGSRVSDDGRCDFLVMRLVEGDSPPLWEVGAWLEAGGPDFRLKVGASLLAALAPIRQWPGVGSGDLAGHYRAWLCEARDRVAEAALGVIDLPPAIDRAGEWLAAACGRLSGPFALHHGDFRLGNAVFRDGTIAALLDWERAMPGHPLHDVGYLCLPGMKRGELIGGVLTQDELASVWADQTGSPLDLTLCALFRIIAIYTELCTMIRALTRQSRGKGRMTGSRTLPLVAQLHLDLILAIQDFDNDRIHL